MKSKYLLIFLLLFLFKTSRSQVIKGFALPVGSGPSPASISKRFKAKLKVAPDNNVWIVFTAQLAGTNLFVSNNGAARFDGTGWINYNIDNSPLPTNYTTDIAFDGNKTWISSKAGLARLEGTIWTIYKKGTSGIVDDSINALCMAKGKLWIATDHGISVFYKDKFTAYTNASSGLANDHVYCVEEGNNDEMVFGTSVGLCVLNTVTGKWTTYDKDNSTLKKNNIRKLKKDNEGNIWISTDTAVVEGVFYSSVYILSKGSIKALAEKGDCTLSYADYPVVTNSFACLNGKFMFDSYRRKQNADRLLFMESKNNKVTRYEISPYQLQLHGTGVFMDYDADGNLWFVGESSTDSLYKFTVSNYTDPSPEVVASLDINKVNTPVLLKGDMFWDTKNAGYEVPKGSCKKALFAGAVWMGGVSNGNLRIAAQTYRQSGNDYWGGPLSNGTASIDAASMEKYNKIWKLNRYQVETFKNSWNKPGYTAPADIITWPGNGDTSKGQSKMLAPFEDLNNNQLYEPGSGEYPKIRGDMMLYWIFNDRGNVHSESQGVPLGVEVHGSAYAYACDGIEDGDSNEALNYTTFYHFDVYNRGQDLIDSFRLSYWLDADLGNYADDFVGCNVKKNYGFVYNGDDNDEDWAGYGKNPPALAAVALKGPDQTKPLNGFVYYNNDFTPFGNPTNPEHYWTYMKSKWKDGSPVSYGGNGKGGSVSTNYMYPGVSDPVQYPLYGEWSEETVGNTPGDRRMLITSSPVPLAPSALKTFDYALVYSRLSSAPGTWPKPLLAKLEQDVDKVQRWFDANAFPSCFDITKNGIGEIAGSEKEMVVYPNPAGALLHINARASSFTYTIIDLAGKCVLSGQIKGGAPVSIESLDEGIYFVSVVADGVIYTRKVVKQNR